MSTTDTDTDARPAARFAAKLRAVADFMEAWPDISAPTVTASQVKWYFKDTHRWRAYVHLITRELGPRWVVTRYSDFQTLTTTIDTRLGMIEVLVPLYEQIEQPVVNLDEFKQVR